MQHFFLKMFALCSFRGYFPAMTSEEFVARQSILGLNNSELAAALHSNSGAVSRWTKGRVPIPGYIAVALDALVTKSLPQMELPLSLHDLAALDREARARGISVPRLIADILHAALHTPQQGSNIIPLVPAPDSVREIAEEETPYRVKDRTKNTP